MQEHVQVDSTKCKACRRCEFACIASHHGIDIKAAMKLKDTYTPRCWAVKGDSFKTSVRCHCCNPAPCCNICPTGALEQNADGSFSIHPELCAGCMMCVAVCPYGVISPEMVAQGNVVDTQVQPGKAAIAVRCDLCHDWRLEKGVAYTACMEACAARALVLVKADGSLVEAPKIEKKAPPKPAVEAAAPKTPTVSEQTKPEKAEPKAAESAPKETPAESVSSEKEEAPKEETPKEEAPVAKETEQAPEKTEEKPVSAAKPEAAVPRAGTDYFERKGKKSKKRK